MFVTVTITELKRNLEKYLTASATEEIYVTRYGKTIACITAKTKDRDETAKSLAGILPSSLSLEDVRDNRCFNHHSELRTELAKSAIERKGKMKLINEITKEISKEIVSIRKVGDTICITGVVYVVLETFRVDFIHQKDNIEGFLGMGPEYLYVVSKDNKKYIVRTQTRYSIEKKGCEYWSGVFEYNPDDMKDFEDDLLDENKQLNRIVVI